MIEYTSERKCFLWLQKGKKSKIIFHRGEPLLIDCKELDDFCSKITKNNINEIRLEPNAVSSTFTVWAVSVD